MIIFTFTLKGKNFTHNISSDRFVLWIYYNNDDTISIHDKVKVIKNLADEYDLSWDPIPLVQIFKALQHEISGNIIAFVSSAKFKKQCFFSVLSMKIL